MIGAVMKCEPRCSFPSLLNGSAVTYWILDVEDPIAFRTAELDSRAELRIGDHLPHWTGARYSWDWAAGFILGRCANYTPEPNSSLILTSARHTDSLAL
jgi:hypothetical protein